MSFANASASMLAELAADESNVAVAIESADRLLASPSGVALTDLEGWWRENRNNICKWSQKIQHFPFNVFGFIRRLGELAQKMVQLVDALFGIEAKDCDKPV